MKQNFISKILLWKNAPLCIWALYQVILIGGHIKIPRLGEISIKGHFWIKITYFSSTLAKCYPSIFHLIIFINTYGKFQIKSATLLHFYW